VTAVIALLRVVCTGVLSLFALASNPDLGYNSIGKI
jgi:hypothetical protein